MKTYEQYFEEANKVFEELSGEGSAVEHLSEARRENSAIPYDAAAVTQVFKDSVDEEVECFVSTVNSFLPDGEKSA